MCIDSGPAVESPDDRVRALFARLSPNLRWAIATPDLARAFGDVVAVPTLLVFDRNGKNAGNWFGAPPGGAEVQMFLADKSKRYSPKTVLALRNLLSKIFGTAQQWGYLQANPAKGTQVPAQISTKERLTLAPQQVRALLEVLGEPYRTMVLLAVLSGLRRGEIFGLRWKCIEWAEGSLLVLEANYEGHSAPPKTRASRRKVFVDVVVLEGLRNLRPAQSQPDDFVFHTDRGTALNPNNVLNRVLIPACRKAGIPQVSWHNFRYTYSTWANPTGESIKALQAQLGHTDSRLTLSVYTQPMPEAQKKLAGKIARVLLPDVPKFATANQDEGVLIQ